MKEIRVKKRNGTLEPYQVEKIQRQIEFACGTLAGVSQSQVELGMHLELFDGITTSHIDQLAVKAAVGLIDSPEGHTNYQFVAGRLQNSILRKNVYGQYEPPPLWEIVNRAVDEKLYDPDLLKWYSEDDWNKLDSHIQHKRDEKLSYAAIRQFQDKYLVRNRATGVMVDTPQVRYMVAAATVFGEAEYETQAQRLVAVIDYYNRTSNGEFTLPTPQLAGLGTPTRQFSSCVLIKADDTMDSIFAAGEMIAKYSGKRAGIGLDMGRLRALGASVRNGELKHTGCVPFLKKWFGDLRCASQGGIRNSSMTVNYPWWHAEFQTLIVLKNNRGTEETRVRHIDYCVALSNLLFRRMKKLDSVSLFDPNDVPDLYEAFYRDPVEFERLYEHYEKSDVKRTTINAMDVVNAICTERSDTGRIYLMFMENVIEHTPFDVSIDPIYQTNLCAEILLPTQPFQRLDDIGETTVRYVDGSSAKLSNSVTINRSNQAAGSLRFARSGDFVGPNEIKSIVEARRPGIALCTLGSLNFGKFSSPEQMRKTCHAIVRGLDNILDFQSYLSDQSYLATQDFRPLGVGVTNLAYWHANRGFKYGQPEALKELARWMEHMSFYLIEASVELAKERGTCKRFHDTRWSEGYLPWECSPNLDEIREWRPELDWEALRDSILTHGVRNATLMALPPVESSSVAVDSANGFEIPKSLVTSKDSRGSILVQVVPSAVRLKNQYELMWEVESCEGYLKACATMAQFVDQSLSANTFFDPAKSGGKIDRTQFLRMIMLANKWGMRTLYYNLNNKIGIKDESVNDEESEVCEACVL